MQPLLLLGHGLQPKKQHPVLLRQAMTPPWHLKRAKQPNELVMLHGLLTKPRNLLSTQTPLPVLPAPPAAPQPALQTMLMRQQPLHPKQLPPQEPVTKQG